MVWGWVAVVLPYLETEHSFNFSFVVLYLEKALFIFAITLPFDIRDLKIDAHHGVKTIPARIGSKKTKILAAALMGGSVFLAFLNVWFHFYPILTGFFLLGSGFMTVLIIYFADKTEEDYYFTGLVDGTMLLQFALVYLSYQLSI